MDNISRSAEEMIGRLKNRQPLGIMGKVKRSLTLVRNFNDLSTSVMNVERQHREKYRLDTKRDLEGLTSTTQNLCINI